VSIGCTGTKYAHCEAGQGLNRCDTSKGSSPMGSLQLHARFWASGAKPSSPSPKIFHAGSFECCIGDLVYSDVNVWYANWNSDPHRETQPMVETMVWGKCDPMIKTMIKRQYPVKDQDIKERNAEPWRKP